jgi:dienelactone hydrolase
MRLFVLAFVLLTSMEGAAAPTVVDHVVITSRDGVRLKGTYFSPGQAGPGIVLFHQCDGRGRESWGGLPRDLAAAGFHVLTFDNRGAGESQRGREAPNTIAGDADAAYSWLAWQQGVDKTRMAAGGSSCGVGSAASLLTMHPLRALVLISGGVASTAMTELKKTPDVAIFGVGSKGDPTTSNLPDAVQASKNPLSTMKAYDGGTHGVSLFLKDRELRPAIVQWLQSVMK